MKSAFFYADGGMVASTYQVWLQLELYTLTGIFECVGLRKKVRKTVGMVCQNCQAVGVQADEAYTRSMTG